MSIDAANSLPTMQRHQRAADELVRVNLLVPAMLRKEWKAVALSSDLTLTDLIVEAMSHQIARIKETEITTI